jgi:FKBP-type peptidyl-prolyl cis-trans isomerase SlyD
MSRSVVTFHFTLRDPAGRLLDSSQGGEPVTYLEGAGTIIEGLEAELRGQPAGTRKKVIVPAALGYGERDAHMVQRVKRRALPVENLQVGDRFQTGADRHAPVVTIVALEGDEVVLDANHPLAGVDLSFEVEIVAARPATTEEIKPGATAP